MDIFYPQSTTGGRRAKTENPTNNIRPQYQPVNELADKLLLSMLWAIYLSASILTATFATLLQRAVQKDSKLHPLGYIALPTLFATIFLLVLALIRGFDTRWDLLPIFNLLLAAVFWPLTNVFYVFAMRHSQASQFSVIFTTRIIWIIIASFIFLGERLSSVALIGALFLLASSVLAVWEEGISYKHKGVIFILINAMVAGFALTNDGVILSDGYDVISYYVIGFGVSPLALFSLSSAARNSALSILRQKDQLISCIALAILYAVSAVTLFYAFNQGKQLNILASLNQVQTILIVLGAALILKERKYFTRRMVAAVISFIGVLLILNS